MQLRTKRWVDQAEEWPGRGRCILAQHDDSSIVVYQAYNASIADYALEHGRFGKDFSFARSSWIKPGFLWMMYRSGWATKPNQERILGLRLSKTIFDRLLEEAVPSAFDSRLYEDEEAWKASLAKSDVVMQWDPDHHPSGAKLERRAIQLGLRRETLHAFATEELLEVIDLTEFVAEQRRVWESGDRADLLTPAETVYLPADAEIWRRMELV